MARSGIWFWTQQEAENYCTKHGFEYEVQAPNMRSTTRSKRFASYGNNFRLAMLYHAQQLIHSIGQHSLLHCAVLHCTTASLAFYCTTTLRIHAM